MHNINDNNEKEGNNLQIYNLESKSIMKTIKVNSDILFWRWLDGHTIAYVTPFAVYHWSMEGDAIPEEKFEVLPGQPQTQFISYDSSKDGNWLSLQGIVQNAEIQQMEGVLKLYSVQHKRYQPTMNAFGGCFAEVTLSGRESPCILFCFARLET
ncbi:clathrin heavy chain 1, partial [Reticulomyxa filosa]